MASLSFVSSSHLTLRTPSLTLRRTSPSSSSVSFSVKAQSVALSQDDLKKLAAEKAVEAIKPGMVLGLGTGSTAAFAVDQIGKLLASGELHDIVGIPTSKRTEEQARSLGIPLVALDTHPRIDLAIDGADEVDPNLDLVKGRGGALLREKMVEAVAERFIVVADDTKLVKGLGGSGLAMPVEVVQFCWKFNLVRLRDLFKEFGCDAKLRVGEGGEAYVTDNSNYIIDLYFKEPLKDGFAAGREIGKLEGVVEHGLFLGMATSVIIAGKNGVEVMNNPKYFLRVKTQNPKRRNIRFISSLFLLSSSSPLTILNHGRRNKRISKGRKGGKKKIVDPFSKKDWYDIKAPSSFTHRNVGKTLVSRTQGTKIASEGLKHRVFEVSLADLNKDEDQAYRKIRLRAEDVQGRNVLTQFWGMDFTTDKLRSLVKKWQTLIESHVDVKTTDNYTLRLFCIAFTKRRANQVKRTCYAQSSQIRQIRSKMREIMIKEASSCDLKELVAKFIPESIGKDIEKATQGIYPLQNVFIRKVKILKAPKFDLGKLMEVHGDYTAEDVGVKVDRPADEVVEEPTEIIGA
ncbi:hypothetical protein IGI04_004076 [Brassica rapa subsp. trilocularis]|uniref:Small ribosomal subunit protein eS1 n=1 Tax=Brassica rapa subsp. trilocularis TaxID=1813537 RepID=A0ABQ7P088_BRACM|nr:hypothetical protein IGI04_004076 [Brassica rapa subsp. trilocularis]